jgi:hypothetical protein
MTWLGGDKLGVNSRTDAIIVGTELGLVGAAARRKGR